MVEDDWLSSDEQEVIRAFLDAEVRFIVIGGRAVQFYIQPRHAHDLDLLIDATLDNWIKFKAAINYLDPHGVPHFDTLAANSCYQHKLSVYPTVDLLITTKR